MDSIFPVHSMDRTQVCWEDYLGAHTPWELKAGIWFKREDYFAPLGYGGPNGSKMRQLIWYVNRHRGNATHIVTGASVQSPQLSMSAIVGAHYGLPITEVVYSKPNTLMSHPNPRIAAGFGAAFEYARGPYNPIIQARVRELTQPDSLVVEYGITLPVERFSREEVRDFHWQGARQLGNVPREVTRLIVPAGSCNSLTSIILGLLNYETNIREVFTIGIGPDKRDWVTGRLRHMGLLPMRQTWKWRHFSLHDTGYSTYSEKFNGQSWEGIDFHPTYEAKMWHWLRAIDPIPQDGKTAFWIVGSAAQPKVIEPFYTVKD